MAEKKAPNIQENPRKIGSFLINLFRIRLSQVDFPGLIRRRVGRGLFVVAAAAGIFLFGTVMAGSAGDNDPGSTGDPLVTRSYVESQLKDYADRYLQWKVVDLAPGQRLEGGAGTELIVRVGQAVAVDPTRSGIPDVTAGANIAAGQNVALNHHLIIPRSDGRGVSARTKAVVMYRGDIQVR